MSQPAFDALARRIRHDILTMTTRAASGHPTSSLSAVELMTILFFKYLRYDLSDPKNPSNDRVIFSKGHASPLYYALYAAAGVISAKELEGYRLFDSVLEGHPTPRFRYTEAATGSLGQGLSIGLGEALALRLVHSSQFTVHGKTNSSFAMNNEPLTMNKIPRVFVLAGDGELAEGSVWEAAAAASYKKVTNLFLFVDINRLGQSDPTMYAHDLSIYEKRFAAFGWRVVTIERGNDMAAVEAAWADAVQGSSLHTAPTVVLAKTQKGAGISVVADKDGWHGKPLPKDMLDAALAELGEVDLTLTGSVQKPSSDVIPGVTRNPSLSKTGSQLGGWDDKLDYGDKPVATRRAFGNALKRLGELHPELVVTDGDVKNSTYTELFGKAYPDRFFELFIAEQNMAGVAVGLSARGYHPVVSSFACFLTRAADQLRMASLSGANILVNGSHAGVSIGEDGSSQMGLEDLAVFRAIGGSTVLYPSDAISTERLVELALEQKGIVYIRTSRPETPILYSADDTFALGGSRVFDSEGLKPTVTVVAAGVTLHEALSAQKTLNAEGVGVRVIDCYSIKPIDVATLKKAATETQAIIVVEDHYPEGGLGEAVMSALSESSSRRVPIISLAVRKVPRSGRGTELMAYEEIDASAILKAVQSILSLRGSRSI
jgi:transketolase